MFAHQLVGFALILGLVGSVLAFFGALCIVFNPIQNAPTGLVQLVLAFACFSGATSLWPSKDHKDPSSTPERMSEFVDGCATYRFYARDRYRYFVKCQ